MLCVTSFFKNEHPRITVSQNAYGNRKPRHLWCLERTPVSLSLPEENCVASLFVRFFTSLLMSTQIKMTIQSLGSDAQSPPLIPFHEKRKCNESKNPVHMVVWVPVHVHTCDNFYVQWIWSGFWNERGQPWGLKFHSSSDFPTMLSHCHKLQSENLATN